MRHPELQKLALSFLATFFTRHLTCRTTTVIHLHAPRKFFAYVTWDPWAYVRPPDREVRGSFHRLCECWGCLPTVSTGHQWNKFARTAGGPKKFLKQGPAGKSPGFPVGQSAASKHLITPHLRLVTVRVVISVYSNKYDFWSIAPARWTCSASWTVSQWQCRRTATCARRRPRCPTASSWVVVVVADRSAASPARRVARSRTPTTTGTIAARTAETSVQVARWPSVESLSTAGAAGRWQFPCSRQEWEPSGGYLPPAENALKLTPPEATPAAVSGRSVTRHSELWSNWCSTVRNINGNILGHYVHRWEIVFRVFFKFFVPFYLFMVFISFYFILHKQHININKF